MLRLTTTHNMAILALVALCVDVGSDLHSALAANESVSSPSPAISVYFPDYRYRKGVEPEVLRLQPPDPVFCQAQ